MTMKYKSMHYLRSGLTVVLGAGATLASSFLVSRLREKQDVESRLDRLEQMIDDLGTTTQTSPVSQASVPQPPTGDLGAPQKVKRPPRKTEK